MKKIYLIILCLAELSLQDSSRTIVSDIYGNRVTNDVKYSPSTCCLIPTCSRPGNCYQTTSCGHLCGSGKYPPAEFAPTIGYQLKNSYTKYTCWHEDCRLYEYSCKHCPNPDDRSFNINLVRQDCKECYTRY